MNILLLGSGGREHALAIAISKSPLLDQLYIAPGNPGTAHIAAAKSGKKSINTALNIANHQEVLDFAIKNKIGLLVVGPEDPLVDGIADVFRANNIPVFGPNKQGARLEGSKYFAKQIMKKYAIPTAQAEYFNDYNQAKEYLQKQSIPIVIKADGLAAGKGVTVAQTMEQALEALHDIMIAKRFGDSSVLIEEFMDGEEASMLAFTDGKTIIPMIPVQDHKRVGDNDTGPNTGGMGTYAPTPLITPDRLEKIVNTVLVPTMNALNREIGGYIGVLYAGLMVTKKGEIKVVEYNCRFGDPETQVILPLLKNDLLEVLYACATGKLADMKIEWLDKSSVCVVMAAKGYPDKPEKGAKITLPEGNEEMYAVHAGTALNDKNELVVSGGRVLGIVAVGDDFPQARQKAYDFASKTHFDGMHYRKDIGKKGLKQ